MGWIKCKQTTSFKLYNALINKSEQVCILELHTTISIDN